MNIYLAASYSRRAEMRGYRDQLESAGHYITSSWLDEDEMLKEAGFLVTEDGSGLLNAAALGNPDAYELCRQLCGNDLRDVCRSNVFVGFSNPPGVVSRGGRHVELGIALCLQRESWHSINHIFIVGAREHIFHYMDIVQVVSSFEEVLEKLNCL